jgi:hypothetical protein
MAQKLSLEKQIEYLAQEWTVQHSASQWNFDIIEKQRNYGFIFFAAIFGISGTSLFDKDNFVWILVPPVVVILMLRITTQLEFISIRLNRILDIESKIEEISGLDFLYRSMHKFSLDYQSATIYAVTYAHIYILFLSIFFFSLYRIKSFLPSDYFVGYCFIFVTTVIYLSYRGVVITLNRSKRKKPIKHQFIHTNLKS